MVRVQAYVSEWVCTLQGTRGLVCWKCVDGLWGCRMALPALKPRLDSHSVSHHAPDREVQAKARHGEDGEYPTCTGLHVSFRIP